MAGVPQKIDLPPGLAGSPDDGSHLVTFACLCHAPALVAPLSVSSLLRAMPSLRGPIAPPLSWSQGYACRQSYRPSVRSPA
jgi:hypothetical protein